MMVDLPFDINSINPDWSKIGVVVPPFSIEPNPRFMYFSQDARRALAKVSYMVESGQGASVLVGEVGTGKTTLASWFYDTYARRPDFVAARVDEPPKRSGLLLLRRIAAEFGLRTRRSTEDQLNEFRAFLVEKSADGILPLIIIDEAHELGVEQFVDLRRLLNFRDPSGGKAFQLILLGRPELDIKLREAPDFNDRIATRSSLDPLTPDETKELIEFRLYAAGLAQTSDSIFTDDAIPMVWRETRGYPRSICMLCLHITIDLLDSDKTAVDAEFVEHFLSTNKNYRQLTTRKNDRF